MAQRGTETESVRFCGGGQQKVNRMLPFMVWPLGCFVAVLLYGLGGKP